MKPIITVNQYPIGWEWLDRVPLEDFTWLIEIFSIMTDNTDTYDFVGYTDSETLPGQQKVCSVDKIPLANFLNDDQGYESGISMYGHYIACKCLDISSEREYMNRYTDIRILTNEPEPWHSLLINSNLKQYGNTTANIHCIYTHHRQPRTNMITSLIAGQEMTNINIFMTTTRTNTQNITTN